jgi:hypothetical protein
VSVPTRAAEAVGQRQALEEQLDEAVYAAMSRFMVEIEHLALTQETAGPPLTAAASHWATRSLGTWSRTKVLSAWDRLVIDPITRLLAVAVVPSVVVAYSNLQDDETPSLVADTVEWVLWSAAGELWTRRKTAEVLSTVLSMDPAVRAAADQRTLAWLTEHTASWDARSRWIARTEATRSMAASSMAEALANGYRFKRWASLHDDRVRTEHRSADGQVVEIEKPFDVGGYSMMQPGDPDAPVFLTANCRCVLSFE